MERRLLLAKQLLNPDNSVLIVTIDEKEYLRLGLLLQQTFPSATHADGEHRHQPRADEPRARVLAQSTSTSSSCFIGSALSASGSNDASLNERDAAEAPSRWRSCFAHGDERSRGDDSAGACSIPIFVDRATRADRRVDRRATRPRGDRALRADDPRADRGLADPRATASRGNWQASAPSACASARRRRATRRSARHRRLDVRPVTYLTTGHSRRRSKRASSSSTGRDAEGALDRRVRRVGTDGTPPTTVWNRPRHDAGESRLRLLLGRSSRAGASRFPKSLYAVEDAIRFFVGDKPDAVVARLLRWVGNDSPRRDAAQPAGRRAPAGDRGDQQRGVGRRGEVAHRAGLPRRRSRVGGAGHLRAHHPSADHGRRHGTDARRRRRSRATTSSPTSSRWPRASRRTSSS